LCSGRRVIAASLLQTLPEKNNVFLEGTYGVIVAPFKRLLLYIAEHKMMLILGLLCVLAANSLKAAIPIVLQQSVDALTREITRSLLLRYSAIVITLALLQGGLVFVQDRLLPGIAR